MKLEHGQIKDIEQTLRLFAPGHYADEIAEEIKIKHNLELSIMQIRTALQRLSIKTGMKGKTRRDKAHQTMFFSDMVDFIRVHQYDYNNEQMYEEMLKAFPDRKFTYKGLVRCRRKNNLVYRVCTPEMLEFMKENRELPRQKLSELIKEKFGKDISRHRLCALMSWYGLSTDLRKDNSKRITKHKIGDIRDRHGHKGQSVYSEIMIAENKWIPYQRYIYEKHHGVTLGKDMNVIFVDGNSKNFDIDNLYAIPVKYMAVMAYRGIWTSTRNQENLDIGLTLAKLNLRLTELKKKKRKEEKKCQN